MGRSHTPAVPMPVRLSSAVNVVLVIACHLDVLLGSLRIPPSSSAVDSSLIHVLWAKLTALGEAKATDQPLAPDLASPFPFMCPLRSPVLATVCSHQIIYLYSPNSSLCVRSPIFFSVCWQMHSLCLFAELTELKMLLRPRSLPASSLAQRSSNSLVLLHLLHWQHQPMDWDSWP